MSKTCIKDESIDAGEVIPEVTGCIVGAVMQVNPVDKEAVRKKIQKYECIEIHGEDEQSRWVITMETMTSKQMLQLAEEIQNIPGVLSVMPVYQHSEHIKGKDQEGGWTWR